MHWVTVYLALNPADAQLVCSRLDASGLTVNLADELSALSIDGYALASGGIRVQVLEQEVAEARAVLASDAQMMK